MTKPEKIIEKIQTESLRDGQSKQDYLDYLKDIRFSIEMQIEAVEQELEDEDL
jgi:hypothetical protein